MPFQMPSKASTMNTVMNHSSRWIGISRRLRTCIHTPAPQPPTPRLACPTQRQRGPSARLPAAGIPSYKGGMYNAAQAHPGAIHTGMYPDRRRTSSSSSSLSSWLPADSAATDAAPTRRASVQKRVTACVPAPRSRTDSAYVGMRTGVSQQGSTDGARQYGQCLCRHAHGRESAQPQV